MDIQGSRVLCEVTFFTENGELVARGASLLPDGDIDGDVISVVTMRDMGADAPTFSMALTMAQKWHKILRPNDLVYIKMCRPPETKKTIFVGLIDDARKKIAVNDTTVDRYVAVVGRGVVKSFIQFDIGIVPEAEVTATNVGWIVSNGGLLAGSTCKDIVVSIWDKILKRLVDYSWSDGKTLFDLIGYDIKNRDNMILLDDTSLINWQGNVWSLIQEIAESPFYERFWEIVNEKPTLIIRPTPFGKADWPSLERIDLYDEDVNIDNTGLSDLETYTIFSVGAKTLYATNDAYRTFNTKPMWNPDYAKKYGIRRYHVYSSYINSTDDTNVTTNADLVKELQTDLYNWNIKNNSFYNGNLTVKGSNKYKVGTRLLHHDTDGTDTEYYMRSVTQHYLFGSWSTDLGVIRGIAPVDRFSKPWMDHPYEYTGLGLGSAPESVASYDKGYSFAPEQSALAEDIVNGAIAMKNMGLVKYSFGANNVSAMTFDCSSFTQYVFSHYGGIEIGRSTSAQLSKGTEIPNRQDLIRGDLVFFKGTYVGSASNARGVSHVGIYIGNNQFVHNSSGSMGLAIGDIYNSYYTQHWLTGKRVIPQSSSTTSSSTVDGILGGVLKGQGATFISLAQKYNIDPYLVMAISMHETGNGTSNAARTKNNVGGMMSSSGLMSFASITQGVEAMTRNLKNNYIDKGLTTIPQIQKKYAPIGAGNDPTGLNTYWVSGVTKYYNKLIGL